MNQRRRFFTEQELKLLKENNYTLRVTPNHLTLTKEFKEHFWNEYSKGISAKDIVLKCGYDTEVLGDKRIDGIRYCIKKEFTEYSGFYSGRRPSVPEVKLNGNNPVPTDKRVKQLESKVRYLEQEIEFIKKIFSTRDARK